MNKMQSPEKKRLHHLNSINFLKVMFYSILSQEGISFNEKPTFHNNDNI